MIVKAVVKHVGENAPWEEALTTFQHRPLEQFFDTEMSALDIAKKIVEWFNNTLRPGERAREVVSAEFVGGVSNSTICPSPHDWEKKSLVTVHDRTGYFDLYECRVCHTKGRRYGLDERIQYAPGYEAKVFQRCDTAKAHRDKVYARRRARQDRPSDWPLRPRSASLSPEARALLTDEGVEVPDDVKDLPSDLLGQSFTEEHQQRGHVFESVTPARLPDRDIDDASEKMERLHDNDGESDS